MSVGSDAFRGCSALETVTIGSSVLKISSDAFYGCSSLVAVYYEGTKSEWESINGYDSSYLKNATIICTDGTYSY